MRLRDDRVITPSTAARRLAARCVLQTGAAHHLLVFRFADTHLHALLASAAREVGAFVRALATRLHRTGELGGPFEHARLQPVLDQQHLYRAARYILRQGERHGIDVDPLHDASSLPDLIAARVVDRHTARLVRERMPRFDPLALLPPLEPAPVDLIELRDAAAAAFALPDLLGREAQTVQARRAAVHVGRSVASPEELATALGVCPRSVRRLLGQPVPPAHTRAVNLQLQWRAALKRAAPETSAPPRAPIRRVGWPAGTLWSPER